MLILNVDISHNSKDWLMWLTIESERTKKGLSLEKICGSIQTGTPFNHWVISRAINLGF
jgi:hypothetical protein